MKSIALRRGRSRRAIPDRGRQTAKRPCPIMTTYTVKTLDIFNLALGPYKFKGTGSNRQLELFDLIMVYFIYGIYLYWFADEIITERCRNIVGLSHIYE